MGHLRRMQYSLDATIPISLVFISSFFEFLKILSFHFCFFFEGGWWFQTDWDHNFVGHYIHDIRLYFYDLWVWRTSVCSFRTILRKAHTMRLAFITAWHTAIVHDIPLDHTTIHQFSMLWTHFMHTGNVEEGRSLSAHCWKWKLKLFLLLSDN